MNCKKALNKVVYGIGWFTDELLEGFCLELRIIAMLTTAVLWPIIFLLTWQAHMLFNPLKLRWWDWDIKEYCTISFAHLLAAMFVTFFADLFIGAMVILLAFLADAYWRDMLFCVGVVVVGMGLLWCRDVYRHVKNE